MKSRQRIKKRHLCKEKMNRKKNVKKKKIENLARSFEMLFLTYLEVFILYLCGYKYVHIYVC